MTTIFVDAGELMARRSGSVNPARFPDEEFELHSIPAFDAGMPEILRGDQIGSTKQLVAPNDVMISKIVPHIRRSTIVPEFTGRRQIASSEWIVFRGPQFFPDYLRHFLISNDFHARFMKTVSGVGGSLLRARPAEVAKIKIPLPPLAEQRRLAGLLSRAEGIVRRRREAQRKAAELVPALFLEMFGDPASNPKGWQMYRIDELLERFEGGKNLQAGDDESATYRILKISAVTSGRYIESESKPAPNDLIPAQSHFVRTGDLLISRANTEALVGATAIVDRTDGRTLLPDKLWRFVWRSDTAIEPRFALHLFQQPAIRNKLSQLASGTGGSMKNISQAKLKTLELPVPPIELQRQFAAKADAVRGIAAQQAAAWATAQATFDALLYQSFQH